MNEPGAPEAAIPQRRAPVDLREERPVTVITGATAGIGLGLAREFAKTGHALLLVARSADSLAELAHEITTSYEVPAYTVQTDLTGVEGCESIEAAIKENGLYVQYLVNNAGFALSGTFADHKTEELMDMLGLNIGTLTLLMRRYWPGMLERREGGVLNLSSLGGYAPGPYQGAYYATKSYVTSLTEAMAYEALGTGVKVSVVAPGPVATKFHEQMGTEHGLYIKFLGMMDPMEVARIAYTNFMCGQTVIIPGLSNIVLAPFLRIMPHFILVPFAAWLLKARKGPS